MLLQHYGTPILRPQASGLEYTLTVLSSTSQGGHRYTLCARTVERWPTGTACVSQQLLRAQRLALSVWPALRRIWRCLNTAGALLAATQEPWKASISHNDSQCTDCCMQGCMVACMCPAPYHVRVAVS